jgi:hypothetical protein
MNDTSVNITQQIHDSTYLNDKTVNQDLNNSCVLEQSGLNLINEGVNSQVADNGQK